MTRNGVFRLFTESSTLPRGYFFGIFKEQLNIGGRNQVNINPELFRVNEEGGDAYGKRKRAVSGFLFDYLCLAWDLWGRFVQLISWTGSSGYMVF